MLPLGERIGLARTINEPSPDAAVTWALLTGCSGAFCLRIWTLSKFGSYCVMVTPQPCNSSASNGVNSRSFFTAFPCVSVGERRDYRQAMAGRQQVVAKGLFDCTGPQPRYLPEKSSIRQFGGPFVTKSSPKSLLFSGG